MRGRQFPWKPGIRGTACECVLIELRSRSVRRDLVSPPPETIPVSDFPSLSRRLHPVLLPPPCLSSPVLALSLKLAP